MRNLKGSILESYDGRFMLNNPIRPLISELMENFSISEGLMSKVLIDILNCLRRNPITNLPKELQDIRKKYEKDVNLCNTVGAWEVMDQKNNSQGNDAFMDDWYGLWKVLDKWSIDMVDSLDDMEDYLENFK